MKLNAKNFLAVLILLITFISASQWMRIPLGSTALNWIISFLLIIALIWCKKLYFYPANKSDYWIVTVYLFWAFFGILRGIFVAENYWEYKQLINGSLSLMLPLFVYVFSVPDVLRKVLFYWIRYAIPLFFLFFIWNITPGSYHFYLGPALLLGIWIPVLQKKWQIILIILLALMVSADLGARSQVIKGIIVILISSIYIFKNIIPLKLIKLGHWVLYIAPVLILYLAISGVFNPFDFLAGNAGKYTVEKIKDGESTNEDLAADTRTFIYYEVITSAINHKYVLIGRTPARGNDSASFGEHLGRELGTGKYERHKNEVCFPNVFTWLGLIGMILYCLIYLKSSYLAVFKSNNIFMRLIGLFIAFRFMYGWIEDGNTFAILSISIWMMIGMGFSSEFRQMDDNQFKDFIKSIFRKDESTLAIN